MFLARWQRADSVFLGFKELYVYFTYTSLLGFTNGAILVGCKNSVNVRP